MIRIPAELKNAEIELSIEEKNMLEAFGKEMSKPIIKTTPSAPIQDITNKKLYFKASEKEVERKNGSENEEIHNEEKSERVKPVVQKVKREFRVITDEERPLEVTEN